MEKDDNILDNFGFHLDEEFILDEQDIKRNHKHLVSKNLDIRIRARDSLFGSTSQDKLIASELLSSLEKLSLESMSFLLVNLYQIFNIIIWVLRIIIFFIYPIIN